VWKERPVVVVIGGPNGAGKSTIAPLILRDALAVAEFVNADVVARGLSAFDPESVAMAAGRAMLERLRDLARRRQSFGFETTLSTRSFAPWLRKLSTDGYRVIVVYVWIPSPELSIQRIQDRIRAGGHFVPDATVRRRFARSLRNFFQLYQPLATSWSMVDNSHLSGPELIASGEQSDVKSIGNPSLWERLCEEYSDVEH
jgi:predicted ABC-type ATPase